LGRYQQMNKVPTESQEQIAVIQWCKRAVSEYPEVDNMFHIPNGGKRNIATAARLKLEGVKPGVPDLFLAAASRGYHGLFIEMKRLKGGSLSGKQKEWFKNLKKAGYACVEAEGAQRAIALIKSYLRPVKSLK